MKLYERALALAEPLGVNNTSTQAGRGLIRAHTSADRPLDALASAGPSLARHHRAGSRLQAVSDLLITPAALAAAGRPDVAASVVGWFLHVNKGTGHGLGFPTLEVQLRDELGAAEVERILVESAALTEPHLIDLVLQAIDDLLTGSP